LIDELRTRSNEREKVVAEARRNAVNKAGMALEESVEVILNRLNVPSKSDIDALSKKISALTHKVGSLVEQQNRE